ncbi:hypothetical protein P1X15_09970 [Runella sp. MFBS21]|uniref:hypothetical protein n=1 Tax=Runella sp. MFBS21 TaxID=3034018 RepID=UPI0023F79F22|nr:hypothetical protein [Runella sp. MFBS21]MDF7817924.1 hypothetical protein [Runella sp. MFBS21]
MMTLETRINGYVVDQNRNQKGSFERLNPYLTYEAKDFLTDSAKIPALPFTPTNRAIFGYIDIPNLGSDVPRFEFEQYLNGHLVQEGTALLTDFSDKGYQLTIVQPVGEFFGDIQKMLLSEIDFGTLPLPTPLAAAITHSGQNAVCFPTVVNPDYYGTNGASISYSGKVNDYGSGAYTTTGPKVPFVFVRYLLSRIATLAGVTIDGSFMTDADCGQLVLYNIRELEGATEVTLRHHLPELTVVDFIVELRKYLNLSLKFNTVQKRLTIDFTDSIFGLPCEVDWSDKLVIGARKVLERSRRLQLSMELDANDTLQKDRPAAVADYLTPSFADDLTIAKLSTKFSTLLVESGLASARQQGATSQFAQLEKKSSPRLLFWQGMVGGYPAALPTRSGKSLYWNGVDGLVNWAWAKTEAFRRQIHYLDCQLLLTEADLALLDFKQKVHINGVNYLPVRLSNSYPIAQATSVLLVSV